MGPHSASVLTESQFRVIPAMPCPTWTPTSWLTVELRHDDRHHNGHNTFVITGEVSAVTGRGTRVRNHLLLRGAIHDIIAVTDPELGKLCKWHLTSTDGPLHYIANTLYWLGYTGDTPNIALARRCAIWPEMPEEMLAPAVKGPDLPPRKLALSKTHVIHVLEARLPRLLEEFRTAVESVGFRW